MTTELSTSSKSVHSLLGKDAVREQWDAEFEQSHPHVARNFAKNFALEIILKTYDPYTETPSRSAPRYHIVSLNVETPKNLKRIVELLGNSALLKPFKEWSERFQKETSKMIPSGEPSSAKSDLEVSYFQPKMIQLGKLVVKVLNEQLEEYAQKNTSFKYTVKWFDTGESLFDFFSTDHKNYIGVATWFDKSVVEEPSKETHQSEASSSVWDDFQELWNKITH